MPRALISMRSLKCLQSFPIFFGGGGMAGLVELRSTKRIARNERRRLDASFWARDKSLSKKNHVFEANNGSIEADCDFSPEKLVESWAGKMQRNFCTCKKDRELKWNQSNEAIEISNKQIIAMILFYELSNTTVKLSNTSLHCCKFKMILS
jgi:hypothetical protein